MPTDNDRAAGRRYYAKLKKEGGERFQKYKEKRLTAVQRRWRSLTPDQRREEIKQRRKRTAIERRNEHLKARYNLTIEQWDALFETQGRCCAICKTQTPGWTKRWHTDHDHKTEKFRAILCQPCNVFLAIVRDDKSKLYSFIEYLDKFQDDPQA